MVQYCRKCGEELEDDAEFCESCGFRLNENPNDQKQKHNLKKPQKTKTNF